MIDTSSASLMTNERVTFDVEVTRFDPALAGVYKHAIDDALQFALKTLEGSYTDGTYPDPSNFVGSFIPGTRERKARYSFDAPADIGRPMLVAKPAFTIYLSDDREFAASIKDHPT